MRNVEFVPLIIRDKAEVFTLRVDDERETEYRKFILNFNNSKDFYIQDDLHRIVETIKRIAEGGCLESLFRTEGSVNDRIFALPLLTLPRNKKYHGTLRIYCIRVSEQLLIIGGGGLKHTKTYEEDPILLSHIKTLQSIDKALTELEKDNCDITTEIYNLNITIE
jgi:hypothetical protein